MKTKNSCNTLDEYFKKLTEETQPSYYVQDIADKKTSNIECLFILESPHVDEIRARKPLMGSAGKYISAFFNLGEKPFGDYEQLSDKKIGIMNVSNIPLKPIEGENADDVAKIKDELEKHRENNQINETLFSFFTEKIKKYTKVKTYVVCGTFAEKYFDKYVKSDNAKVCLNAFYDEKINILKVPHPSYGHWQFIDKHKDNLDRLRKIFAELK